MKKKTQSSSEGRKTINLKFVIALVVVIVLVCSVPIMASADIGNVYDMLYIISPGIAQMLKPVNLSCEKEGVEISVISADITGDTASIYISITDKGAGVIDEKIDLYDSYRINTPFDAACSCKFDKYDSKTKTAYYYLTISEINGNNIEKYKHKKITFSVGTILSAPEVYKGPIGDIDLKNAEQNSKTEIVDSSRVFGGSSAGEEEVDFSVFNEIPSIVYSGTPLVSPTDFADVTAIGFVDGKLHVQMFYKDRMINNSYGLLSLKDKDGNEVLPVLSKLYCAEYNDIDHYEETVFDISYDEISNYTLYGELSVNNTRIDGNWNITFRLD